MNFLAQMLPTISVLASALAYFSTPVACSVGLSASVLGYWMRLKWPTPKPAYMPVINRPNARTLRKELCVVGIAGGAMILTGLICVLLLPKIMPVTFMTHFWTPMGANFVGQGVGSLVFGWIAAPKEVAEHNAWLLRMGGNFSNE